MINLPVDEAYAFDYLAILYIKINHTKNKNIEQNYEMCQIQIKEQIGENLFNTIIQSPEYQNMLSTNKAVFDAVEKARYGDISAKEVDSYNMQRYKSKNELQQKFFPKVDLTEWKS